jgi:tetrahydromethanopterin S-methyltransferase subunit B
MEKETDTDKILRDIANVHERVDEMASKMATKDDLKNFATKDDLAAFKDEVAALISSGFAKLCTEDIEPVKRDIAGLKQNAEKVWNVFAPRLEYDDRLRVIEQKLGIPSPK